MGKEKLWLSKVYLTIVLVYILFRILFVTALRYNIINRTYSKVCPIIIPSLALPRQYINLLSVTINKLAFSRVSRIM